MRDHKRGTLTISLSKGKTFRVDLVQYAPFKLEDINEDHKTRLVVSEISRWYDVIVDFYPS